MSTENTPPTTQAPSPPPSTQPAATGPPAIDPAEYEALQNEVSQWRSTFAVLDPQSDRIKRLVQDPNAGQLFDDAIAAYENIEARRKPKVTEELTPIYDKVSKLESFVDRYEQQQKEAEERPAREFTARYNDWQNSPSNNRFFTRLMADHPELKQRDIQYLAQFAVEQNFEPLEETWKREGWRFVKPGEAAPPTSLRTDVGDVGIPGESVRTQPPQQSAQQAMRAFIVDDLKRQRGA